MTFLNHIEPGFFKPNNGQWFPTSQENIDLANDGKLKKSVGMTELGENETPHPITGTSECYSLYDRFDEKNSTNPADVLRRLTICPEIHANVNSESHEQLHSVLNKDNCFLNMMNPATHVFMKRLLVHLRNKKQDEQEMRRQEAVMRKHGVTGKAVLDSTGRVIITRNENSEKGRVSRTCKNRRLNGKK